MEALRQQQLVSELAQYLPDLAQKTSSQRLTASDLDALEALLDNHRKVRAGRAGRPADATPPRLCVWQPGMFRQPCACGLLLQVAASADGPGGCIALHLVWAPCTAGSNHWHSASHACKQGECCCRCTIPVLLRLCWSYMRACAGVTCAHTRVQSQVAASHQVLQAEARRQAHEYTALGATSAAWATHLCAHVACRM